MFRYEGQALAASAEIMKTVCRELNECEEEIRALSRMLDRNPEIPAPRYRLHKCIEQLEERETSLNLTRRKLDCVRRLYEEAEGRIRDLAEETEGMNSLERDAFGEDNREKESSDHIFDADPVILFPTMRWVWPLPGPAFPGHFPGLRPYPFRPHRPLFPFPPRRRPTLIDPDLLRRLLIRLLPGGGKPMPQPRLILPGREREAVLLPFISGGTSILEDSRIQRRDRIAHLFRIERLP